MEKNKFKSKINKNIDINNDDLINNAKKILCYKNPTVSGSYVKYGRSKACDLDLEETININNPLDINNILDDLCNKLYLHKTQIKFISFYFDITDFRITSILKSLGYINGNFEIIDCDLNINIDKTLPEKIKNKIILLIDKLKINKNLTNYITLYSYLKKINKPNWTLSEFKKKEKIINGIKINLLTTPFKYIYINIIFEKFRISNYLRLIQIKNINKNTRYNIDSVDISDILLDNKIFYYFLLKKIQVLLKYCYFNKIFKERFIIDNAITFYNEIYDFRENVGIEYNKFCLMDNEINIEPDKDKLKILKKNYKIEFDKINYKSKELYDKIYKVYSKYFNIYLKFTSK
jgi:hypothetical protein